MRTSEEWVCPISFEECDSPPGVIPVAEPAPLSPVAVTQVAGPAPLSPFAIVPVQRADDAPAVPAAVVAPATSLDVLCFPALFWCFRNRDLRRLRLTTQVVYHADSDTAASEALKSFHAEDEALHAQVVESWYI